MGMKNRDDEEIAVPCPSSWLSEALLLATVSIIGLPVDVHVKDGSVYSGIFYTASDGGIVLKKAKLTKGGKRKTNVASGSVIETLVILSADFVQVVAEGSLLMPNVIHGNAEGESVSHDTLSSGRLLNEANISKKSGMNRRHVNPTRCSNTVQNHFANGVRTGHSEKDQGGSNTKGNHVRLGVKHAKQENIYIKMNHDGSDLSVDERQSEANTLVGDGQNDNIHQEEYVDVQSASSSLDSISEPIKPIEEDQTASKNFDNGGCCDPPGRVTLTDNSSSSSPTVIASSESCQDSLASSNLTASLQSLESRKTKEFKLNPGAKTFSPSFAKPILAAPAVVPSVANMAYVPSYPPMVTVPGAAQPEVGMNPFSHLPLVPSKLAPYGNPIAGNGVSGSQFSQTIVGQMGNRLQPLRYGGQFHHVPPGPMFVNMNSQVVVGPMRHPVYMHPVSMDSVQSASAISPVPSPHLMTAQQVQYPKHQGSVQLCMPQPLAAANGQQAYALPGHIPFLQPPFPINPPIGSNGFFGPKLP